MLTTLVASGLATYAQSFIVSGKVIDRQGKPVSYASIRVHQHPSGTVSNEDGSYSLTLQRGIYNITVSLVGFESQAVSIVVDRPLTFDILFDRDVRHLAEVVVTAKKKDRAEEIMREVIRRRDSIRSAARSHSFDMYVKATLVDSGSRASKAAAMAEILAKVDVSSGGQIKEQRLAVRGKSRTKGMFYLSASEGDFNIYDNLVNVPSVSSTPIVSPVSPMGLIAYQFRTVHVEKRGQHRVYTFSLNPMVVTNATFTGEITVSDSAWVVLHSWLRFPGYHLQVFDFFEVEQHFGFVDESAWMITRQTFTYGTRGRRHSYLGETTVHYSNFEVNKLFARRHFNAEVSATAQRAYERDSTFWQAARVAPLSRAEADLVRTEDSLMTYQRSERYLDSMDRVVNRVTWQKLGLFGQSLLDHRKERTWHFSPLSSFYKPFAFGGGRFQVSAFYAKTYPSRKYNEVFGEVSYGIRNSDINGRIDVYRRYDPFRRAFFGFSAGREFSFINEGDALINMIRRNNFYLNNFVAASQGLELANGLFVSADVQLAVRQSVDHYKTGKLADSLLAGIVDNNQAVSFDPYNALYGKMKLQYTPAQRYRREPKEKIILGSKWPTFYMQWEKGIPHIANSRVDFDYLEVGLEQSLRLRLLGVSRYTIRSGEFLSRKELRFIDYKIQRRGDPLLFMNPYKSFQALDSTFPVFRRFLEGHYFHEFNGLIINKIPLLKKLQLREVGGAGVLYAPERKLTYAELYVGIERAFTSPFNPLDKFKLGVYVVGSAANQMRDPVQFKIGFTTWDKRRNRWF